MEWIIDESLTHRPRFYTLCGTAPPPVPEHTCHCHGSHDHTHCTYDANNLKSWRAARRRWWWRRGWCAHAGLSILAADTCAVVELLAFAGLGIAALLQAPDREL